MNETNDNFTCCPGENSDNGGKLRSSKIHSFYFIQHLCTIALNFYQQYSGNGLRSTLHKINESTTESTKFNDVNEGDQNEIKIENIAIPNESKDKKKD